MKRKISTLFILAALVAYPAVSFGADVNVEPGPTNLSTAISAAAAGDVLILQNGGVYDEYEKMVINKKITIKSATNPALPKLENLPKIINSPEVDAVPVFFELQDGADISFIGVEIDNNQGLDIMKTLDTVNGNFSIFIDRCRIHNCLSTTGENGMLLTYPSDLNVVTNGKLQNLKAFNLTNSILYDLGGRGVYFKNFTGESTILIENNTFYNIGQQMVYVKWAGGTDASKVKITFNHNTCYNLGDINNPKPKEILGNAGGPVTLTIKNNIFMKQNTENASALVTTATAGATVVNINNNIFNGIMDVTLDATDIRTANQNSSADPTFTDIAKADFTIGNADVLTAADDSKTIGALYWDPAYTEGNGTGIGNISIANPLSVYPNPISHNAEVSFTLNKATNIDLALYNISGQEVMKLASGSFIEGPHTVNVDASKLNSGVYFCKLKYSNSSVVIKLLVTR